MNSANLKQRASALTFFLYLEVGKANQKLPVEGLGNEGKDISDGHDQQPPLLHPRPKKGVGLSGSL